MLSEGMVVSQQVEGSNDPEGKFAMYRDYREPAAKIPSHRMLAIRRGENENILFFQIELDQAKAVSYSEAQCSSRRWRLDAASGDSCWRMRGGVCSILRFRPMYGWS